MATRDDHCKAPSKSASPAGDGATVDGGRALHRLLQPVVDQSRLPENALAREWEFPVGDQQVHVDAVERQHEKGFPSGGSVVCIPMNTLAPVSFRRSGTGQADWICRRSLSEAESEPLDVDRDGMLLLAVSAAALLASEVARISRLLAFTVRAGGAICVCSLQAQHSRNNLYSRRESWLRGQDLNLRPSGYELFGCDFDPLRANAQKYANYLISLTFVRRRGILLCDRLRRISFPLADIVLTEGRAAA